VLSLDADLIDRYGGTPGVRSIELLGSALTCPVATFGGEYLHGTPHEMAGAYLFHLVKNHPFIDGNKRIGLMVMLVFLGLNGLRLDAGEDVLTDLVVGVANGRVSKAEVAGAESPIGKEVHREQSCRRRRSCSTRQARDPCGRRSRSGSRRGDRARTGHLAEPRRGASIHDGARWLAPGLGPGR
jgi:death-on-curing protein